MKKLLFSLFVILFVIGSNACTTMTVHTAPVTNYAPPDAGRDGSDGADGRDGRNLNERERKRSAGRGALDEEQRFFRELSENDPAYGNEPNDQVARRRSGDLEDEPGVRRISIVESDPDCNRCPPSREKQSIATTKLDESSSQRPPRETNAGATPGGERISESAASSAANNQHAQPGEPGSGVFFQEGTASWYGRDFDGRPTASGEIYDSRKLTAAHRELPMGTVVLVRNLRNDREVMLTINDRGPFVGGRIIDVSEYSAELLGFKEQGLTPVGLKIVRSGDRSVHGTGATERLFTGDRGVGGDDDAPSSSASVRSGNRQRTNRLLHAEAVENPQPGSSRNFVAGDPVPPGQVLETLPVRISNDVRPESEFRHWAVQVGVFGNVENAIALKRYLSAYREPVHILRRGENFVVKVGEYSNRAAAEPLRTRLSSDGYNAFVAGP